MKTKPFSELRNKMSPERRARNEIRTKIALIHLTLMELQTSLGLTHENLEDSDIVLPELAMSENQENIDISALSEYIKALGGSLKIVANFPEKEIVLAQFDE
ncbi:transcriptional regulator [Calothrix sp. HK-06]|nr:transcriptional regulator [Calothrix sp. HK-06]